MKALLTRKVGMTSTIDNDGSVAAVTLLSASPNTITQIKGDETDGYIALQLGFEEVKAPAKPQAGHLKPSKVNAKVMREIRITELSELKVGDQISADLFSAGDIVD